MIYYTVRGFDRKGVFDCQRRFSDFESLRAAWRKRLPGVFIPYLPPKKFFGNTEAQHLEERSFLLEQFLKKVYRISYLLQSVELEMFARITDPITPLSKSLDSMPALSPQ